MSIENYIFIKEIKGKKHITCCMWMKIMNQFFSAWGKHFEDFYHFSSRGEIIMTWIVKVKIYELLEKKKQRYIMKCVRTESKLLGVMLAKLFLL